MKYIAENTEFKLYNSAVSLGKFDGIHIGHRLLINKILSCKEQGYTSAVFTFHYHPYNLFSEKEIDLIDTEEEKKKKFENMGLDVLVAYPFTEETASLEPEEFIESILIEKLDAKIIVVGSDYRFGHKRRGDVSLLRQKEKKYGYRLIVCDKLEQNGEVVSSSRIRSELKEGNMSLVNEMLGQPYCIMGEILHGRKLGRTFGMPTINMLPPEHKLLPPNGVYASRTVIDGKTYEGVTNIGYKPTVGAELRRGVETYLFEMDSDVYGKTACVELYSFERGEKKFGSVEELKIQMQKDAVYAKEYFKKSSNTLQAQELLNITHLS